MGRPRKKPIDFDGNPDRVTLGLGLRLGGGGQVIGVPRVDHCNSLRAGLWSHGYKFDHG